METRFIDGGEYVDRKTYIAVRDENSQLRERIGSLTGCQFPDSQDIAVIMLPSGNKWATSSAIAKRIAELEANSVLVLKHWEAEEPGDLCFNEVTGLHAEADFYRIAELEGRSTLALRLYHANYPGFIPCALKGEPIPQNILDVTDRICEQELGGDDES